MRQMPDIKHIYKKTVYNRLENIKPFCFHGTKKRFLESILNEGIHAFSGVYGKAVYSKLTPHKTLRENYGTDALVCIYHLPIKSKYVLENKRDWILFPNGVDPQYILYSVEVIFDSDFDIKRSEREGDVNRYFISVQNYKEIEFRSKEINYVLSQEAIKEINRRGWVYEWVDVEVITRL